VRQVLAALERMGVLAAHPPTRLGGASTYTTAEDFEARVGIRQIGDALVLAAALLAQGPLPRRRARGLAGD
jgi:chromosome segregation and condensation protein ScpB